MTDERSAPTQPSGVRRAFEGRLLAVDVETWPQGEREVVHHPGAAGILARTPDGDVLLVRQRREPVRAALLEIPAGTLDVQGEDPAAAAARELLEETGHRARGVRPLAMIFPSPGFSDERIWLFEAGAEGDPSGPVEPGLQVVRMPLDAAIAAVADGRIVDAKTVVALLLAARGVSG